MGAFTDFKETYSKVDAFRMKADEQYKTAAQSCAAQKIYKIYIYLRAI